MYIKSYKYQNFFELMEFRYLYIYYEVSVEDIYRGGWRIEIYNKGILIKFSSLLLFNILYDVRNNIIWDSVMIQKDIGALLPTIWMIIINIVCRTPMYDITRNTTKSAHMNGHWKDYDNGTNRGKISSISITRLVCPLVCPHGKNLDRIWDNIY